MTTPGRTPSPEDATSNADIWFGAWAGCSLTALLMALSPWVGVVLMVASLVMVVRAVRIRHRALMAEIAPARNDR